MQLQKRIKDKNNRKALRKEKLCSVCLFFNGYSCIKSNKSTFNKTHFCRYYRNKYFHDHTEETISFEDYKKNLESKLNPERQTGCLNTPDTDDQGMVK
jgi:hypothetical protein